MTRNTDSESTPGLMDASIMGCGKMVNSMGKVSIYCLQESSDEGAGEMVFAKNGWMLQANLLKLQPVQIQVTSNRNLMDSRAIIKTKFEVNMCRQ